MAAPFLEISAEKNRESRADCLVDQGNISSEGKPVKPVSKQYNKLTSN
jgi:hypothetical protein